MKRNSLLFSTRGLVTAIVCAFLCFISVTVEAQVNPSVSPDLPISNEDLPKQIDWKSPSEYAAVVANERTVSAQQLASPATKELDFALYTAYDRMLAYMQDDLNASIAIEEIADKNYKRVLTEAFSDPNLVNLEMASFNTLYNGLLILLQQ